MHFSQPSALAQSSAWITSLSTGLPEKNKIRLDMKIVAACTPRSLVVTKTREHFQTGLHAKHRRAICVGEL
jgi:hypothetical protein